MEWYLFVECRWFVQYLSNEQGTVWDCYLPRLEPGNEIEFQEKQKSLR